MYDFLLSVHRRLITLSNSLVPHLIFSEAHQMVEDCSRDHPHIVCWSQDGTRFEVKEKEALETDILPLYFNHSAFSSFSKQMNVYGFLKWKTEPIKKTETVTDSFMFQHEFFRRGRLDLLKNIKRKPTGSSRAKKAKTSPGEVQNLEQRLAAMEKTQTILRATVQKLEQVNNETRAAMEMMQKRDAQKDESIRAQELRIRELERKLQAVTQQQQPSGGALNPMATHLVSQSSLPIFNKNTRLGGNAGNQQMNQTLPSIFPPPATMSGNRMVSAPSRTNSTNSEAATLRPHPNKKSLPAFAPPAAAAGPIQHMGGNNGATLRPHPNKKSLPFSFGLDSSSFAGLGGNGNTNNGDPLSFAVFRETSGDSLSQLLARYDSLGERANV